MKIQAAKAEWRAILQAAATGDLDFLRDAHSSKKHNESSESSIILFETAVCLSGCYALHWVAGSCACPEKAAAVIDFLVEECGVDVNQPAKTKSIGRTALHYACRNGRLETVQLLVQRHGANPDARAKAGVTPFQLAIWRNPQCQIAQWLVQACGVDPRQTNDFACGAMHWLGLCPPDQAGIDGQDLVPTARWLVEECRVDPRAIQRQGHNALHKVAWGGHLALARYLHEEHGLWDDLPDDAGYYAVDLAEMAYKTKVSAASQNSSSTCTSNQEDNHRHAQVAAYLRRHCSRNTLESCHVLGISMEQANADPVYIRQAYHRAIRRCHPDKRRRQEQSTTTGTSTIDSNFDDETTNDATDLDFESESSAGVNDQFLRVTAAYRHLIQDNEEEDDENIAHNDDNSDDDVDGSVIRVASAGSRRCYRNRQAIPFLLPAPLAPDESEASKGVDNEIVVNTAADDEIWLTQSRLRIVLQQHGRCSSGGGGDGGGSGGRDEKKADVSSTTTCPEGLDLSNLRKWWQRCWPDVPFPVELETNQKKKSHLKAWIKQQHAVVYMRRDDKGVTRLYLRE